MRRAIAGMMMLGAGVGAAWAEPATREAEARSVVLFPIEGRGWHGRAFAQLGVDEQEGMAAVGAEGRYEGARCDYLKAGGQVRLGVNDSARMAVEQWASVCVPVITMEFGHHLEWDVRPSLLAPLGLRPGLNRRETVHFHWQPLRGPLPRVLAAVERGESKKQGLRVAHHAVTMHAIQRTSMAILLPIAAPLAARSLRRRPAAAAP